MNENLASKVQALALARRSAALRLQATLAAKEAVEKTTAWAAYVQLRDEQAEAAHVALEIEEGVRSLALEIGEKHPHPAVEVTDTIELHYVPEDAIKWCIETRQIGLLKLDTRGFEKVARVLSDIPMVAKSMGHGTRIASDLTAYEAHDDIPF